MVAIRAIGGVACLVVLLCYGAGEQASDNLRRSLFALELAPGGLGASVAAATIISAPFGRGALDGFAFMFVSGLAVLPVVYPAVALIAFRLGCSRRVTSFDDE